MTFRCLFLLIQEENHRMQQMLFIWFGILFISREIYRYLSKRKLHLSLTSIHLVISVHPIKFWSIAQSVRVPSMRGVGNQKAPNLVSTEGVLPTHHFGWMCKSVVMLQNDFDVSSSSFWLFFDQCMIQMAVSLLIPSHTHHSLLPKVTLCLLMVVLALPMTSCI